MASSRSQSATQSVSDAGVHDADEGDSAWAGGSVRSPSPTNTEVSVQPSASGNSGAGSRNFARQGAYQPGIQARVQTRIDREGRQQQEAQMASTRDESSDDEDWEL
jgi:hypothetical protein